MRKSIVFRIILNLLLNKVKEVMFYALNFRKAVRLWLFDGGNLLVNKLGTTFKEIIACELTIFQLLE